MLFDLRSGKRRRVIQVVYSILAALFLLGFVFFGIGSDVGSLDPTQLFGGDDNPTATQFEAQIDEAEQKLEQNPRNENALADLARYRYLSGQAQLEVDDQGQPQLTDEARQEWNAALDAWERYLELDPEEPDATVAGQAVAAYQALGDAAGAVEAQRVIAAEDPSADNYALLAFFLYSDARVEQGDKAADQAVAEASGAQARRLERELERLSEQAARLARAERQAGGESATGENALQNPFGGLGGGGVPPTSP